MKAKEVIVLILIIGAGIFFYYAQTGKLDLNWEIDGHFLFRYKEFTFEETEQIEGPLPSLIKINNAHGQVEVQSDQEEKITISFQKIIWRKNEEQAEQVSKQLKMKIDRNKNQLSLSTNRDEFRRKNFKTNFLLTVPAKTKIEVSNSYGLVRVSQVGETSISNRHGQVIASDIAGNLTISNSYQKVEVAKIEADCQVESKHAPLFLEGIKGKTEIKDRYGQIKVEDAQGPVKITGSHSQVSAQNLATDLTIETSYKDIILLKVGPVKITNKHAQIIIDGAQGPLEINHSYGQIKLNNLQGNIIIEGKNMGVKARSIEAQKIYISSSYKNIELAEFKGETSIYLAHGAVSLKPAPLTGPIKVEGRYTDIKLFWPFKEKYPFEAQAKSGEIRWNLPAKIFKEEKNSLTIAKAFVQEKEKPSIFLATSYGTISVEE